MVGRSQRHLREIYGIDSAGEQSGPTATSLPTVGGTPTVGQVLTGTNAAFTGGATVTRQWLRDGEPISGATGATYTLVEADEDAMVQLQNTGSNSGGAKTVRSAAVGPVAAA